MLELEKWKLHEFEYIVLECQDIIAEVAVTKKAELDFDYYLLSSYAKAILNIREVLCLLNNGLPDGALSRARNVYEQMITMHFISRHKDDKEGIDIIERYFYTQDIQSYLNNRMYYRELMHVDKKYKNSCIKEITRIEKQLNNAKARYPECKESGDYWWASNILKSATFNNLQNDCNAGLFKVLYKRACISTHASAMGDSALLGRVNPDGNILTTQETYDGFEAPILLSMGSFAMMTYIVFKYFNLKDDYSEKLENMCGQYWKTVFL